VERRGDASNVDYVLHVLRLYESDEDLVRAAVDFVAEGLSKAERVLALLTDLHWKGVFDGLDNLRVPHDRAVERGQFVLIDAGSMLDEIVVDGAFDPQRFEARLRPFLNLPPTPQRMYGEMTTMLAMRDNVAAALALEQALQELVYEFRIPLLCAVNVSGFTTAAARDTLRRFRQGHDDLTTRYRERG
jgi:hypothetical protein